MVAFLRKEEKNEFHFCCWCAKLINIFLEQTHIYADGFCFFFFFDTHFWHVYMSICISAKQPKRAIINYIKNPGVRSYTNSFPVLSLRMWLFTKLSHTLYLSCAVSVCRSLTPFFLLKNEIHSFTTWMSSLIEFSPFQAVEIIRWWKNKAVMTDEDECNNCVHFVAFHFSLFFFHPCVCAKYLPIFAFVIFIHRLVWLNASMLIETQFF